MKTVKRLINGHWRNVTLCPPRVAKGATAGKPSTVSNGHHFQQVNYNLSTVGLEYQVPVEFEESN